MFLPWKPWSRRSSALCSATNRCTNKVIGVVAMMMISCNRVREIVKHKTSLRMQIIRFQHDLALFDISI